MDIPLLPPGHGGGGGCVHMFNGSERCALAGYPCALGNWLRTGADSGTLTD